jgi:hypothetical protein
MEKVQTIRPPDVTVIERLETALAAARRGEYLSVLVIAQTRDGIETGFAFAGHANPWALIGAAEVAKHRIIAAGEAAEHE